MRGFVRLAVRDAIILSVTLALAVWERSTPGTWSSGAASRVLGITVGVLVPVVGFIAHEWGHLIATQLSGGTAQPARSLVSFFLFAFNVEKSSRRQFLAMAAGGYIATAFVVATLALWIDPHRISGMIALVLSVLGIGATLVLEIPETYGVARGGRLPSGGAFVGTPRE